MESFTKVIDKNLSVSLSYLNGRDQSKQECIISFINTSNSSIRINPSQNNQSKPPTSEGWLSHIFSRETNEEPLLDEETEGDSHITIRLGYVQLFGYVVSYHQLSSDASTALLESKSNEVVWFMNGDYMNFYHSNDDFDESQVQEVPFLARNLRKKLILGGKVGGINDLSVGTDEKSKFQAPIENQHLLHDLIYPFNSSKTPSDAQNFVFEDQEISLKEIVDSIIPIYTTSQSLLFTDLSLAAKSSQSFRIVFPKIADMPPSYNSNSTGPACDQGLISIKYALVIGMNLASNSKQMAVYFPYTIKDEGRRTMDAEYTIIPKIEKNWTIEISEKEVENGDEKKAQESIETKEAFLDDLSQLIKNDLYHMPKVSKNERRQSVNGAITERARRNSEKSTNHSKSFYKVNVNSSELCTINIMKNAFHPGDDINFCINIRSKKADAIISGISVFLEKDEIYPKNSKTGSNRSHSFKVSSTRKFNTLASNLGYCALPEPISSHQVNGYVNIPIHLSSQFSLLDFMSLKYFLVFKFTLVNFNSIKADYDSQKNENSNTDTADTNSTEQNGGENQPNEEDETSHETSQQDNSTDLSHLSLSDDLNSFTFTKSIKYGVAGSDMKFRLPLTVLS